ncbi:MAG: 1-acyl-sn-glycerol-3-phosphate acyltransferase [Saprospiraceae bacterium]|uniref:1-acyl-sn-glycerol-3-phosphate acyltransferase n=1 Tax=Candidatus Opimibacter skivensis TaxID=2982028 RepID=A0A9D7SY14_9BACT|nr:1-acyl-sn-glycerol-3-phosphate acyltransferase [Candidatus Opimibacter skivensis]
MLANKIRGYIRLFFVFIITILATFAVFFIGILPINRYKWGLKIRRLWSKLFIIILNYKVEVIGKFPTDRNYLFVGNHRSSMDPFVSLAYLQANPVSRSDVGKYPFLGKGAVRTGIIFVDKASKTSRSASKQAIYDALKEGKSIMIYPEGKTGAQPLTATFQKGSFDVAAELNVPVIPFAIEYKSLNDYWDHTDTMAGHYFKNLAKWRTDIRLSIGDVIYGDNSWTLLRQSQQWINDEIVRMRSDWGGLSQGQETVEDKAS